MSELTVNEQRFRVVEVEGHPFPRTGSARFGLSASVLDSACAWKEVARFNSEDFLGAAPGRQGFASFGVARRQAQDRAFEKAAELNLLCRADEAA